MGEFSSFPLGLREVVPNQTVPEDPGETYIIQTGKIFNQNKTFIFNFNFFLPKNAGGTQSTLQEIQLPEGAGGYTYSSVGSGPSSSYLRNRFLSWRSSGDSLELRETSLDWTLSKNRVTYRFRDTPILSGGVTIHETPGGSSVVILVPTVSSVHKMVFPHPTKLHRQNSNFGVNSSSSFSVIPSIFSEAGPNIAKEFSHAIPSTGTSKGFSVTIKKICWPIFFFFLFCRAPYVAYKLIPGYQSNLHR